MSNKKPQVIIIGSGGTGKTAFVKRIIQEAEQKGKKVHVFEPKDEYPVPRDISKEFPAFLLDDYHPLLPPKPLSPEIITLLKSHNRDFSLSTGADQNRKKRKKQKMAKKRK